MAIEEFTVSTNTAAVEQATGNMAAGAIDQVEFKARAQVMTVQQESAKAEQAGKQFNAEPHQGAPEKSGGTSSAKGNAHGELATAILTEATGIKAVADMAEFVNTRRMDAAEGGIGLAKKSGLGGDDTKSFDKDIKSAGRAAGLYTSGKSGAGLFERSKTTEMSLLEQGGSAVKSWGIPPKPQMNNTVAAVKKELAFTNNASDLALGSVAVARQAHSATLHQANQFSPGMGMNGPRYVSPEDALRRAKEASDSKSAG